MICAESARSLRTLHTHPCPDWTPTACAAGKRASAPAPSTLTATPVPRDRDFLGATSTHAPRATRGECAHSLRIQHTSWRRALTSTARVVGDAAPPALAGLGRKRPEPAPRAAGCPPGARPSEGLPRRHPNGGTRRARSHPAPGSTHEGREKKRRHTFPGTENLYRPAGGVTPRTAPGFSVAYHTQQFLCGHDRRLGRLLR